MNCPKCGSEMIDDFLDNPADDPEPVYLAHICPECGREEKVRPVKKSLIQEIIAGRIVIDGDEY